LNDVSSDTWRSYGDNECGIGEPRPFGDPAKHRHAGEQVAPRPLCVVEAAEDVIRLRCLSRQPDDLTRVCTTADHDEGLRGIAEFV
jgi:hypothetical protein